MLALSIFYKCRFPIASLLCVACMFIGSRTAAEEIKVISPDYWCPFGCKAGTPLEGYPIEILRAIFEPQGIKIQYSNMNYSRALVEVRKGEFTLIPSVFKEEAPDFIFSKETISDSRYCFYTQTTSTWRYASVESLVGLRIGGVKSYSYGSQIDAAIKQHKYQFDLQSGDGLTERLVRMLMAGRVDSFIENEYLVSYTAKINSDIHLREAGCEESSTTVMGFSPADKISAQRYAGMFDAGIVKLRRSGDLAKIMERYGLRDWVKAEQGTSVQKTKAH